MKRIGILPVMLLPLVIVSCQSAKPIAVLESDMQTKAQQEHDARMQWWRDARFGMFIHWGLYSIPAGEWHGETNHAEWIRTSAQIPVEEYDRLVEKFDPVDFDADEWTRIAKDAGMKYMVITSKHHDGFCLFDSEQTEFDVMSTPFKRDILKELSEACDRQGLRMCWYHSIMDWHHPDYLPRRQWEVGLRDEAGADFECFVQYLKSQVRELLTNYGPIGVMWFDGEWENTWNHERGQELYDFCRLIQPNVIVNNRVDVGREGMAGMTKDGRFAGDFGTPEQEVPATGIAGVDWESCITMNRHWGFNRFDDQWKSSEQLIRMLVDIVSKGGNFLLNVGPRADGTFPSESIERLREIGAWMKTNGESIYGTQASPFTELPWGRCTRKQMPNQTTRLYMHVFDWPAGGTLEVPGIYNDPVGAFLQADLESRPLATAREGRMLYVQVPVNAPDPVDTVVVVDIADPLDIDIPPTIKAESSIFVDALDVAIECDRANIELRYTIDGSEPTEFSTMVEGSVRLTETATVKTRAFRNGEAVGEGAEMSFEKVKPRPAAMSEGYLPGILYEYYEGVWDFLPDFDDLKPVKTGRLANFTFLPREREERFAFRYRGLITVPETGIYTFQTYSDDGSRLYIGDELVVDNDGLHGARGESGKIALASGAHPITVTYFEKTGGDSLEVFWSGPGIEEQRVPAGVLSSPRAVDVVKPSPRQIVWQEMEFHGFVHFGPNTFSDREWGQGIEDPTDFNPSELDAEQWVRVLRDAGMRGVIVTAKHHDGFCLWPSRYTEHSVANSPWRGGKGDLVREVSEACRKYGIKFGVYLSPWDRHEPSYGDSPRYNEYYMNQLTELLTNYGPVYEVWFDGACGEGPNGKRQVYDFDGYVKLVRELQPDAVIFSDAGPDVRWVGNERGYAGETNWATLQRERFYPGAPHYKELPQGHIDGFHWVPAECDVSIRPGWFYHADQDEKVKSLEELLDIYYGSVGRGAVLLLNVPPDRRGLIHENDVARLKELRATLDETFRVNLAAGKPAEASDVRGDDPEFDADKALDGDRDTYWASDDVVSPVTLTIELGEPTTFDRIMIQERIELGQGVEEFEIEAWGGGDWRQIVKGTTIGYKRLLRIEPVKTSRVRLTILNSRVATAISEFGLFKASEKES